MAYERSLYFLVENEYEEIRRHNQEDLQARRRAVYQAVPEIELIDKEIQSAGLSIVSLAVSSSSDLEQRIASLRDRQKALQKERKTLLLENGFAADELSPRYMCEHCQDTGIYGNKPCECYRRRLVMKAFEKSNLSQQLRNQSFKTFDFSLYSNKEDPQYGISPYDAMQNIVAICKSFIADFERTNKNLLFWGESGLGKTFLSTCIAKELIKKGYSVIYETTYQIVSLLEDYKFKRSEDITSLKTQMQRLYDSDLLILDDLGAEFSTAYTNAALFDVLNSRLITNKKTIINTNLNMKELSDRYSERVISRIMGSYQTLQFIGEDLRLKTSVNQFNE
ncbi:MAG: DNA replication protein DnaC [Ruminococcaceae bacterium]|nr:DNA replication protein DnaC [Oscillospiraceae bacterium]